MNIFHRACCRLVQAHVAAGGRVLEVSCGKAAILAELQRHGYRTLGTNYSQYPDAAPGVEIRNGVDILAGLPFGDGEFDGAILCDVIEHLPDHARVLRELARVLKPGGCAVVLTPNTNRISSRLHYLFTGFHKVKRAFIGFDVPPEKSFAFHNYPPHLPVYLYQAHSAGLDFVELAGVGIKAKNVIEWLLLAPFIRAGTWVTTGVKERNIRRRPEGRLLLRTLASRQALCGEAWAIVHRRRAAGGPAEMTTRLPDWHRKIEA